MELTIVMPVYNEGKNIERAIPEIEKKIRIPHGVFLIYDFPEDNTVPVAKELQKKYKNIKLLRNSVGNGRGVINAIRTGFDKVRTGAVVVMMADLADDPETVNIMYEKIQEGCDVVCGTRYSKGGKHIGGAFLKTLLSRLAGLLTPLVLGIPTFDLTNAFKMYKKKIFKKIKIESTGGFELSQEIVIKAHFAGFKVCETGTTWQDRTTGESRFQLGKWLPKYLYWYFWGIRKRLGI